MTVERTKVVEGRRDGERTVYACEALRHVAMPLGGIGSGHVALGGDGGLRQWQIANQIDHKGFLPNSFFAIRASSIEPPVNLVKVLQSEERAKMVGSSTPLINDDLIPDEQRELVRKFGGVDSTTFTSGYPFARVAYSDAELPVSVELEAYTPFVPLDAEASGLPAAVFTFRVRNEWSYRVSGCVGAALQNAVGWDGITPVEGNACPLYGGNVNRVRRLADRVSVVMENPSLAEDHPGWGQMSLAALTPDAIAHERWVAPEHFMSFLEGTRARPDLGSGNPFRAANRFNVSVPPQGASPAGETWNGGLISPYDLAPGEETYLTFVIAWHFPNRYLNFDQFGGRRDYGKSRFWIGNHYATRFADAEDTVGYFVANRERLEEKSREWERTVYESSLPLWVRDALAAQGTLMRSPTTFRAEDGKLYGFEGSLGDSTSMVLGIHGGSCPLNCTHVWNYEQALAKLFPDLERTMRETDLENVQAPEGYIPHRTVLPLYLPQFWDQAIGGPTNPALDGMLGTVLKVYREVRNGAGTEWLERLWPRVRRLVEYVVKTWDPDGDGVLEGEQPNTYDIAFYGPNMYIGGLWLAALRAAEEMAYLQGETSFADELRRLFERGSARYDELLWNDEYYVQIPDPDGPAEDQFGDGCLSDQLFGQWWAHLLDLGYILPEEHVKTTLRSILRYNFRSGFEGFDHIYRVFADHDDEGLLLCTWPHGGRPEVPVRYCDEVWTGIEYQVGAHMIMEGMREEGLRVVSALRERYSGERRNPYNEVECGDHYARAMAGWSLLDALSGVRYDATKSILTFAPEDSASPARFPIVTDSGWGSLSWEPGEDSRISLSCRSGTLRLRDISLRRVEGYDEAKVLVGDDTISCSVSQEGATLNVSLKEVVKIAEGRSMTLTLS